MLKKYHMQGNSFIGVFSVANESFAFIPNNSDVDSLTAIAKDVLKVEEVIKTNINGSTLIGSFMAMNSNGALVYPNIHGSEMEAIKKVIPVTKLTDRFNAAGNNIVANDNGALVHPSFNDATLERISKALEVPVARGTIAGFRTVGSAGMATNKGAICHPHATKEEMDIMREILDVEVSYCTANYGSGLLGACMMANSKGAIIGEDSTPIELGKVEEGLKLY